MAMYKYDMSDLTALEVARRLGTEKYNVNKWCQRGLLTGARKERNPIGGQEYWVIPESALTGFEPPKRGRKQIEGASVATLAKRKSRENINESR